MSISKSQVDLENLDVVQKKSEVVKKALSELIATKHKTAVKQKAKISSEIPQDDYIQEQPQPSLKQSEQPTQSQIIPRVSPI
jgi:hypothetical protein